MAQINEAAPPDATPVIRSAKCRYIFHNRSRSKLNSEFILAVGNGLASAIHGVLLDHIRPGR